MNPDGTDSVNLSDNPADDESAAPSPDGTRVAFASDRDGDADVNPDICVMSAAGSGQVNVSKSAGADTRPDWQPLPSADLALAKSAAPGSVAPGELLTYTLAISHASGPSAAAGATVTDTLPGGLTFVTAFASQGTCSGTQTVTCNLGTIARGATATVTIQTRPGQVDRITNTAVSASTTQDPNPLNNRASATTDVAYRAGRCANERHGSRADDELTGTPAGDRLLALTGNDVVGALAGDDCVAGGSGSDQLAGGDGDDRLEGGPGRDLVLGDLGMDRARGGGGRDRLYGADGHDVLSGGPAADLLSGGLGGDRILGDKGNDRINGGAGRNRVSGGAGNDTIVSANGVRERIDCGSGRHDKVRADFSDRVRACERVTRLRRR
jgi:uncharacterized repeat protein (TIGR01451 family)